MKTIVSAALALAVAGAFGLSPLTSSMVAAQDKPAATSKQKPKTQAERDKRAPNKQIMALQQALNKHGANLEVDGRNGRATRTALKDFQAKNGLKATGRLDKATRAKLGL